MMKCKIISITHKPSDWEKQALQFYSKQLPNHFQISYAEVKPFTSNSMDVTTSIEAEAAEVLKHVDKNAYVILWDRQGKKINSLGFANLFRIKWILVIILILLLVAPMAHPSYFLNLRN